MTYVVEGREFKSLDEAKKYEEEVNTKNKKKAEKIDKFENKLKQLELEAEKVENIIDHYKDDLNKIRAEIAKVESDLVALTDSAKTDYKAIEEFFRLFY